MIGELDHSTLSPALPASNSTAPIPSAPAVLVGYGSLGSRFLAFCADLAIGYFVLAAVYFTIGVVAELNPNVKVPNDDDTAVAILYGCFLLYMIISQSAFHTSIGKYAVGLEVRSADANREYPSFWRTLYRETLGRALSSLFWGAGYWTAIGNERKQAWSDRMAHTIVCERRTIRSLKRAFIAFLVIAFCVDLVAMGYGLHLQDQEKKRASWDLRFNSSSEAVKHSRELADEIASENPQTLSQWQANMRRLLPQLDNYDAKLVEFNGLIDEADVEDLYKSKTEKNEFAKLRLVMELRKKQSAKLRDEANLVLDYSPGKSDWNDFKAQMRLLDSDISSADSQASEILKQIER